MLFLAIRHLLSKKQQTFLILLGIGLGTTVYVIISGLQLGMREFLVERLMSNTAHIKISAKERLIDPKDIQKRFYPDDSFIDWAVPPSGLRDEAHIQYPQGWFEFLREQPDVLGYSPAFSTNVILSRSEITLPSQVVGIQPNKERQVTDIEKYVNVGSLDDIAAGGSKVIVGDELLKKTGTRVGESIFLSAGRGDKVPFKVMGTFHMGVKEIDSTMIFAYLEDVQKLAKSPGRISSISVALANIDLAGPLAEQWSLMAKDKVESWDVANANFMQIFKIQDISRIIITAAILVVAAFGIYNVLTIMINQKKKEIAILQSIGYPPRMIMELFLLQGIILGCCGAVLGLLIGHFSNVLIGSIDLGANSALPFGNKLIISYRPSIYIIGFIVAVMASIIASLLPARAASKMTPLQIIRSEI